jgi:hypothetical protein
LNKILAKIKKKSLELQKEPLKFSEKSQIKSLRHGFGGHGCVESSGSGGLTIVFHGWHSSKSICGYGNDLMSLKFSGLP